MVLSIRKISHENDDLHGAGALWFPNLNEADPYLVLPLVAASINYFNLSVSKYIDLLFAAFHNILFNFLERHN
tara:strand:- start:15 stop:233 length:219 start_codon:yes stop_codon:yes gene_type:complete